MVVSGAVTRIEPYGVFVALDPPPKYDGDGGDGGGDGRGRRHPQQYRGLAHVSALRPPEQGRVEHPSEIVKLDERVTALVLEVIPPLEEGDGATGGGDYRGPPPQYKIRLSLSAIDPGTGRLRGGYVMPPPRGNVGGGNREQDLGTMGGDAGYYGHGGGGGGGGWRRRRSRQHAK
jgi:hypothetical protein